MKKTKFAYLFATALVAGTMGLTSCQEEVENPASVDGKTTKVAISMSLAQQTRATADEVNMGAAIADINNVAIVPMVGDLAQNVIAMGTFDADVATTHYKAATIPQTVTKFRVYGNLPSALTDNAPFVFPSLAQSAAGEGALAQFVKPHALYYYTEAGNTGTNKFQVGTGADWTSATWSDIEEGESVKSNTLIKIKGVKYAMGVLAVGVQDGSDKSDVIFEDGTSINDLGAEAKPFVVDGIVVEDQPKDFTETFVEKGGIVKVYEPAVSNNNNLLTAPLTFGTGAKVAGANVYCVVAPEDKDLVIANIRFQNKSGKTLVLDNGDKVLNDEYFYLYARLRKKDGNNIFSAATSTLLNATVQDWGRATKEIVESTDVAIGLVIDTAWAKGISYDENI